jgi:hypothetical protein
MDRVGWRYLLEHKNEYSPQAFAALEYLLFVGAIVFNPATRFWRFREPGQFRRRREPDEPTQPTKRT